MKRRVQAFQIRNQAGASLLVVLVLLLVMTLLGLAVLRGTLLEERMSSNMLDRGSAFQAAESALREGEVVAAGRPVAPSSGCNAQGVCALPVATDTDRWLSSTFAGWVNGSNLGTLGGTPQYFVEFMGDAPTWPGCDRKVPIDELCLSPRYRVTARSQAAGRAQVVLQTNLIAQ